MKQTIALCACLLAVNAAAKAGDLGQTASPPAVYGGAGYAPSKAWLAPHEVVAMVRANGLKPLHRPGRHGATYIVRALAPTGEEVRVFLDARIGIVRIDPVRMPLYAMPRRPPHVAELPPGAGPFYGPAGVPRAAPAPSSRPQVATAGPKPLPSSQTPPAPEQASVASATTPVVTETDGTAAAAPPAPATAEQQE
jgi:hypothetical protein